MRETYSYSTVCRLFKTKKKLLLPSSIVTPETKILHLCHWYVSNVSIIFDTPCLFFTPFALCFVTLRGVFMWFSELTYWQDATVPVPYFLLFLCFRKATQEIFSELDETTIETTIFPNAGRGPKESRRGARGLAHHRVARPPPGRAPWWWDHPGPPLTMLFCL
jgi:hypothetical protein